MAYNLPCDWKSGFVMDPTKKQRAGYLVAFNGLDLGTDYFAKDIKVYTPYNNGTKSYAGDGFDFGTDPAVIKQVTVAGVIESFSWGGGVGDPICISAYISTNNANQVKSKMATTLATTKVTKLAWWIVNYDEENKVWFEEAFPLGDPKGTAGIVTGQLNAPGKTDIRMHVSDDATKIAPNIDVNVYNCFFEIVPAANTSFDLSFAKSAQNKVVNGWGLTVGTNAATAMASS